MVTRMTDTKHRIVSLLPSATEIVCGLSLREQLVGISHECNWPTTIAHLPRLTRSKVDASASSADIDRQVQSLMKSGEALYAIDAGLLTSLAPTLILTQSQCDVCAVSYQSVLDLVANESKLAGAKVIALNPSSLVEVLADIVRIGEAAGAADAALNYRSQLQRRIDAVVAASQQRTVRPRTLVIEWTDPLMTSGNWTPDLIAKAGGQSGLAEAGEASRYVAWPAIVDFDPEVLVVAPCGFELERSRAELRDLERLPQWNSLAAVRGDHVVAVDGDAYFNRPGPRLVDSLEMLAETIASTEASTNTSTLA